MNLHGIVSGAIGAINPNITNATVNYSNGYTIAAGGKQIPAYTTVTGVKIQVQALTGKEILQTQGLNLQGVVRAIYLYGDTQGAVRVSSKGGDLILFNGQTWLTATVLETWPDWSKVAATLQVS
jgi:hypothetical protein